MIPYLLILLIPCALALFSGRKISMPAWIIVFFIYLIFIGLRYEVAPDWWQYSRIHTEIAYEDVTTILLRPEPLSHFIFWLSEVSGFHVYLTNIVAALLFLIGVFSFAMRTSHPWLALVAAAPYFILITGMSGVRQIMAAGIALFLLSRWERYNLPTRGGLILFAAMFHTSALINNILLVTKLNIPMRYKIIIGSGVLMLTLYLSSEVMVYSGSVVQYKERYIEESQFVRSFGSLFHIAMIAIPAFLGFIYRKRLSENIHSPALLRFGLYASLGLLFINFYSTTVASRLTIYMYFIPMMVYPALVDAFGRRSRLLMLAGIVCFHIVILVTWFSFGNVSFAYIPYKNVLFE